MKFRLSEEGHNVTVFYISEFIDSEFPFGPKINIIPLVTKVSNQQKKELGQMIWQKTLHSPLMPLMYQQMKDLYEVYLKENSNIVILL